jgi:hypothetical protein
MLFVISVNNLALTKMKKAIIALLSFFTIACAHQPKNDVPIRVSGTGTTYELAKQSAFRDAIELKVGAMVLSERETVNYRRTRDDILVYSAGFVDDFKVIDKSESNSRVVVTMDVWLSSTKLSERLLTTNGSVQSFAGARHYEQSRSIVEERISSNKMLAEVMNEYPKRAYNLLQDPYKVYVDSSNRTILSVGYRLTFDYNWLQSVNASLVAFSNGTSGINNVLNGTIIKSPAEAIIISKNPKAVVLGEKKHYNFSNTTNFNVFRNAFLDDNEVRIKLVFKNRNHNVIHSSCWTPAFITERSSTGSFYGSVDLNKFVVWGNSYEDASIKVSLKPESVRAIANIELSVTSNKECKG